MSAERVERRLAAILAADVAGYSRLMGTDEAGTLARLKALRRELIDPAVAEHKGRIVKTTGDGLLIEFPSVVEAVACAVAVQQGMAERNAAIPPEQRIEFRVGINSGDVIVEDGDIHGDGVNIAARLEGIAEPGGVCISAIVHDQVQGRLDCSFEDRGEQSLKNIARPVRVYRVAFTRLAPPALGVIGFSLNWTRLRDDNDTLDRLRRGGAAWYFISLYPKWILDSPYWMQAIAETVQKHGTTVKIVCLDVSKMEMDGTSGLRYVQSMWGKRPREQYQTIVDLFIWDLKQKVPINRLDKIFLYRSMVPHPFLGFLSQSDKSVGMQGWGLLSPYPLFCPDNEPRPGAENSTTHFEPAIPPFGIKFEDGGAESIYKQYERSFRTYFKILADTSAEIWSWSRNAWQQR